MLDDNCDADMVLDAIGLKFSTDDVSKAKSDTRLDPQYMEILGLKDEDEEKKNQFQ